MSVNKVQLANGETIIDISDSTVTPETLAEGVTAHDASGQKITGKMVPGGGTSVQSDWNQTDETAADFIKNKPFGEFPTGGDTLYWDGNTEGLVSTVDMFYKVSDIIPPFDELKDVDFEVTLSTGEIFIYKGTEEPIDGVHLVCGEFCWIITETGVGVDLGGLAFSEPGIYFVCMEQLYTAHLKISGYTGFPVTKKMEEKYLPGAVILYTDGTYLYKTEDTSDTSKRMTRTELLDYVFSGMAIRLCGGDGNVSVYYEGTAGDFKSYAMFTNMSDGLAGYTAEYVPEG